MESWEKDHVTINRAKLVAQIICNELLFSHLLSPRVLAKVDVEQIKRTNDRYEQASALLDIVETRQNGFVAMARALARVNQTGPLAVFMDGFAQNVIPNMKLNFLGRTMQLTDLLDSTKVERIIGEIKAHVTLEMYVSLYDKSQHSTKPLKLLHDTIPDEISFYVPRLLSKRVKVNPELFKVNCSDIFVFKGIDCSQLAKLMEPQRRISFSSTQLLSVSNRFIILENAQDWEEICTASQASVHLIKYEQECGGGYVLEATTGGSTVIHQFLKRQNASESQNENVSISEKAFFEVVSRDGASGVCICDLPGMGKSLLLANLARKMKQEHPDKIVIFIQLSHFLAFVAAKKRKRLTSGLNVTLAKKMLLEYVTSSQLECFLLTELLENMASQFELFLDGFDEVQTGQVSDGKQLLTELASLPHTRVFVTSRPNMRHELEASLHVISYDILPFSHANQIDFLAAFWGNLKPLTSQEKLRAFAQFCVQELKRSLTASEEEITGIPLQCRLVAQIFSRVALVFAQAERNLIAKEICKVESSLTDLYRRYCDLSFNKIAARRVVSRLVRQEVDDRMFFAAGEATRLVEAVVGEQACLSKIQNVKYFHMLQAVHLILPEFGDTFSQVLGSAVATSQNSVDMLSVGILQRQLSEGGEPFQFVHRTFAEYLTSELFANNLYAEIGNKKVRTLLVHVFFNEVIKTKEIYHGAVFVHSVVMHFLNSACAEKMIKPKDKLLVKTFASCVAPDQLYHILLAVARENHINLLFFLNQLLTKLTRARIQPYRNKMLALQMSGALAELVYTAAEYADVLLVEYLFQLFDEHFAIDLSNPGKQMLVALSTSNFNPLKAAVRRLDYEMVQFFADRIPLKVDGFIKIWISGSLPITGSQTEKMLRILTCLLDKRPDLLGEIPDILVDTRKVHLDIIKLLLRRGVDPGKTDRDGKTLVHSAAMYMTGEDFAELCRVLFEDFGAQHLFEEVDGRWDSPLPVILANCDISEHAILDIYHLPWLDVEHNASTKPKHKRINTDVNYKDLSGRTLLIGAAQGKRNMRIIKGMIEMGANAYAQDKDGNTFVHFIAEGYSPDEYHELVQLLIQKQMGDIFRMANELGMTPLHVAVKRLEILPKTVELLVGRPQGQNSERELQVDNLSNFVDLNALDNDGRSVLYYAVRAERSLALLKYLVGMGADWAIKTKKNHNLAHVSASKCLPSHLKYFVELGCDINERDDDGNNSLQYAIIWQLFHSIESLLETVEFLCVNGAEKGNTNKKKETAYTIALRRGVGNKRILELVQGHIH